MTNALTIDVEDYWSIFSRDWLGLDSEPSNAVVKNTEWFLETLKQFGVKATFFILGEVAVKFPGLVRKSPRPAMKLEATVFLTNRFSSLPKSSFATKWQIPKSCLKMWFPVRYPGIGHRPSP